jgi:hypothetical protein
MFSVGDIVLLKISGEKVQILGSVKSPAIGGDGERATYVIRLPNYQTSANFNDFELEAIVK